MDPNGRTSPEPKVFGIGLSRTGTKSLAGALNLLGIRTKWYPQDPQTYRELLMGEYRLSILKTYQGLADTPVVPYYAKNGVRLSFYTFLRRGFLLFCWYATLATYQLSGCALPRHLPWKRHRSEIRLD